MACSKVFVRTPVLSRVSVKWPYYTSVSSCCCFSTSASRQDDRSYQVLVVGGGCGGSAVANKFARRLGKGAVGVLEPNETHYYQAMWTLVGAGIKRFEQSCKPMERILPRAADWIQDRAASFDPDNNTVTTAKGDKIKYENLVLGLGIQLNYDKIKGLEDALKNDPVVCSNYSPKYVTKTNPALKSVKGGNLIFTFPNTPIKCPGAPQKIVYLTEHHVRKAGVRDKCNIMYNTSLGVLFGVKKYAESLWKICNERNINVNLRTNLVEVNYKNKEATFENLDTKEKKVLNYDMLHVPPPMSAPDVLRNSNLVDETGYVAVDKNTLQSTKYPNVFAIGDCSNIPTSKTAAACAAQALALFRTLQGRIEGTSEHGTVSTSQLPL